MAWLRELSSPIRGRRIGEAFRMAELTGRGATGVLSTVIHKRINPVSSVMATLTVVFSGTSSGKNAIRFSSESCETVSGGLPSWTSCRKIDTVGRPCRRTSATPDRVAMAKLLGSRTHENVRIEVI
jgi:hypothetical protein